jgi:Predicted membrane protein
MSSSIMWFSIVLMVACLLIRKEQKIAEVICGAAWLLFGIYWAMLIPFYVEKPDYTNVVLIVALVLFCLLLAFFAARAFKSQIRRENPKHKDSIELDKKVNTFFNLTKIAAVICIVYMPFKLIAPLNQILIGSVAGQTVYLLNMLGYEAVQVAYDQIAYNGIFVIVILACTAIESIAFFTGLVLIAQESSPKRKMTVFLIAVPAIYLLNLLRNIFVVASYGDLWFGPNSFEIGHSYIAKAGSGIALVVLAYFTLKMLPELMDMILDAYDLAADEMKLILKIGKREKE